MQTSAHAHSTLQNRAAYFFSSRKRSRSEVHSFASIMEQLGDTVAIGGFLRDLLLDGNRLFTSDVDFVVKPRSLREFEATMKRMDASKNRFGGYAIQLSRWKVEVWPLETTWAAVQKHVEVNELEDLLKVTFFTWDAILYSVAKKRVIASEGYFDLVRHRLLDINLQPNPNPVGNAIRAVRYAHRWRASVSKPLADHIARQIVDVGWEKMVAYEKRSFAFPILGFVDAHAMQHDLDVFLRSNKHALTLLALPRQLDFGLDPSTASADAGVPADRNAALAPEG